MSEDNTPSSISPRSIESIVEDLWNSGDDNEIPDDFESFNRVFIQLNEQERVAVLDASEELVKNANLEDSEVKEKVKRAIYTELLKYEKPGKEGWEVVRVESNPDADIEITAKQVRVSEKERQLYEEINRIKSLIAIEEERIALLRFELYGTQKTPQFEAENIPPTPLFKSKTCPCEKKSGDFQTRTTSCQCNPNCSKCQFKACGCPFALLKKEEDE